jgi:predicted nucleotidyltransferase
MKSNSFIKIKQNNKIIWENNTALKILLLFFDNPTKEFYEKQVADRTGLSVGAVNKYLKTIAKEGFLKLAKRGNMNFYLFDRENAVVRYLKIAYSLSRPAVDSIKNFARKFGVKIYVYGSVARGEDTEESDWDILIMGEIKLNELDAELRAIRNQLDAQLKPIVFTQAEWTAMEKKDKAFYERVEKDKIELI